MKPIKIVLSPEAEEVYNFLTQKAAHSKIEQSILNSVNKKKDLIKSNPHYGEPISKDKIPQEFRQKYGVTNLFWVELASHWRMIYSLTNDDS